MISTASAQRHRGDALAAGPFDRGGDDDDDEDEDEDAGDFVQRAA